MFSCGLARLWRRLRQRLFDVFHYSVAGLFTKIPHATTKTRLNSIKITNFISLHLNYTSMKGYVDIYFLSTDTVFYFLYVVYSFAPSITCFRLHEFLYFTPQWVLLITIKYSSSFTSTPLQCHVRFVSTQSFRSSLYRVLPLLLLAYL